VTFAALVLAGAFVTAWAGEVFALALVAAWADEVFTGADFLAAAFSGPAFAEAAASIDFALLRLDAAATVRPLHAVTGRARTSRA
jgi:hypothetical protein